MGQSQSPAPLCRWREAVGRRRGRHQVEGLGVDAVIIGFNMAQGTTRLTCEQAGASLASTGDAAQMACTPCPERHFSVDGSPCQPCSEPEEGQFVEYACLPHLDAVVKNCTDLCGLGYGETSGTLLLLNRSRKGKGLIRF